MSAYFAWPSVFIKGNADSLVGRKAVKIGELLEGTVFISINLPTHKWEEISLRNRISN